MCNQGTHGHTYYVNDIDTIYIISMQYIYMEAKKTLEHNQGSLFSFSPYYSPIHMTCIHDLLYFLYNSNNCYSIIIRADYTLIFNPK